MMQFKKGIKEKRVRSPVSNKLEEALVLYSPNFSKDFLLYTFYFNTSLASILTQKDELNIKRPISFMSASLQGPELNYPTMEKQMYKVVKHLKPYLLKNCCVIFVPRPVIKSFLVQQDLRERRVNSMIRL